MYPSRNTDARRSVEGEKVFLVKHFVSIELNNPPSPEAAQPGDAFAGTPHPQKEPGLPPPPSPAAQRQMAGFEPPYAAGMSSNESLQVPPTSPAGAAQSSTPLEPFAS